MSTPATSSVVPEQIAFTLVGEPRLAPEEYPPEAVEKAGVFGDDFAGDFTFRWPTIADRARLGAAVVAYFQALGVVDATMVPRLTYRLVQSTTFFQILGAQVPAWFSADAKAHPEMETAVVRAYEIAQARLAAEKKSSTETAG